MDNDAIKHSSSSEPNATNEANNTIERLNYKQVIEREDVRIRKRRKLLYGEKVAEQLEENRMGLALSGGGIRSATINLGILTTLNKLGIVQRADYISTVSGGGYTGSYIQGTLKNSAGYHQLFQKEHIDYLRAQGDYLSPGTGWRKVWNQFILVVGYLVSLLMSWISPLILLLMTGIVIHIVGDLLDFNFNKIQEEFLAVNQYLLIFFSGIFVLHYLLNVIFNYSLNISYRFTQIETGLLLLFSAIATVLFFIAFNGMDNVDYYRLYVDLAFLGLLFFLGFFTNPNSTSFHRFYRRQLAETFLYFAGQHKNILLHQLFKVEKEDRGTYAAPYPLINACLNLQSSNDPNFQGTKASDYFLLSPLYCGAKLTGYVSSQFNAWYKWMTLPAAMTISAAAINPGMGIYSSKVLSFLTTILNLRLGYWAWNPLKIKKGYPIIWWPLYFLYELLYRIGTRNAMLNISDGGHIENLAVFELLRRKCRLIIAVDAGEDPQFIFEDLENLTIRARNELGLAIRFRKGQAPEDIIRPLPSSGYSQKRYALADVYQIWDKVMKDGEEVIEHYENRKVCTLVYIKSSVTAPEGRPDIPKEDHLKYGTYKYKIYHPEFPHESTADQFFDPIQWESYYQLGQYIGADILGLEDLTVCDKTCPLVNHNDLIRHFDEEERIRFDHLEPSQPTEIELEKARSIEDFFEMDDSDEGRVVNKKVDYKM